MSMITLSLAQCLMVITSIIAIEMMCHKHTGESLDERMREVQ